MTRGQQSVSLADAGSNRHREAIAAGAALAAGLFDRLAAQSADPPGVTRVAYGDGEHAAFSLMADTARDWNATVAFDAAGNQFITVPGRDRSRSVLVGSHLDTVPHGGNFDGAAGVLLGIALQHVLALLGLRPPFDLVVACLRAEESCWFPHSYIGSKTALGRLDPSVLDSVSRTDTGRSLAAHMREAGFDSEAVRAGTRIIDPRSLVAFIEPHIEQGPVLLEEGHPLGLVTGIRGSFRFRQAQCLGTYAHSGATPLALRRDAVVATAELVVNMQREWEALEASGKDISITFGVLSTDTAHHSFSKVAGQTRFSVDVRSQDCSTLDRARALLKDCCRTVGDRHGVRFELGTVTTTAPALMTQSLLDQLQRAARRLGIEARIMASGAGHDAATFSAEGIPSAMIFIRNANGSHNPDEAMDMVDFEQALALLVALIEQSADHWR